MCTRSRSVGVDLSIGVDVQGSDVSLGVVSRWYGIYVMSATDKQARVSEVLLRPDEFEMEQYCINLKAAGAGASSDAKPGHAYKFDNIGGSIEYIVEFCGLVGVGSEIKKLENLPESSFMSVEEHAVQDICRSVHTVDLRDYAGSTLFDSDLVYVLLLVYADGRLHSAYSAADFTHGSVFVDAPADTHHVVACAPRKQCGTWWALLVNHIKMRELVTHAQVHHSGCTTKPPVGHYTIAWGEKTTDQFTLTPNSAWSADSDYVACYPECRQPGSADWIKAVHADASLGTFNVTIPNDATVDFRTMLPASAGGTVSSRMSIVYSHSGFMTPPQPYVEVDVADKDKLLMCKTAGKANNACTAWDILKIDNALAETVMFKSSDFALDVKTAVDFLLLRRCSYYIREFGACGIEMCRSLPRKVRRVPEVHVEKNPTIDGTTDIGNTIYVQEPNADGLQILQYGADGLAAKNLTHDTKLAHIADTEFATVHLKISMPTLKFVCSNVELDVFGGVSELEVLYAAAPAYTVHLDCTKYTVNFDVNQLQQDKFDIWCLNGGVPTKCTGGDVLTFPAPPCPHPMLYVQSEYTQSTVVHADRDAVNPPVINYTVADSKQVALTFDVPVSTSHSIWWCTGDDGDVPVSGIDAVGGVLKYVNSAGVSCLFTEVVGNTYTFTPVQNLTRVFFFAYDAVSNHVSPRVEYEIKYAHAAPVVGSIDSDNTNIRIVLTGVLDEHEVWICEGADFVSPYAYPQSLASKYHIVVGGAHTNRELRKADADPAGFYTIPFKLSYSSVLVCTLDTVSGMWSDRLHTALPLPPEFERPCIDATQTHPLVNDACTFFVTNPYVHGDISLQLEPDSAECVVNAVVGGFVVTLTSAHKLSPAAKLFFSKVSGDKYYAKGLGLAIKAPPPPGYSVNEFNGEICITNVPGVENVVETATSAATGAFDALDMNEVTGPACSYQMLVAPAVTRPIVIYAFYRDSCGARGVNCRPAIFSCVLCDHKAKVDLSAEELLEKFSNVYSNCIQLLSDAQGLIKQAELDVVAGHYNPNTRTILTSIREAFQLEHTLQVSFASLTLDETIRAKRLELTRTTKIVMDLYNIYQATTLRVMSDDKYQDILQHVQCGNDFVSTYEATVSKCLNFMQTFDDFKSNATQADIEKLTSDHTSVNVDFGGRNSNVCKAFTHATSKYAFWLSWSAHYEVGSLSTAAPVVAQIQRFQILADACGDWEGSCLKLKDYVQSQQTGSREYHIAVWLDEVGAYLSEDSDGGGGGGGSDMQRGIGGLEMQVFDQDIVAQDAAPDDALQIQNKRRADGVGCFDIEYSLELGEIAIRTCGGVCVGFDNIHRVVVDVRLADGNDLVGTLAYVIDTSSVPKSVEVIVCCMGGDNTVKYQHVCFLCATTVVKSQVHRQVDLDPCLADDEPCRVEMCARVVRELQAVGYKDTEHGRFTMKVYSPYILKYIAEYARTLQTRWKNVSGTQFSKLYNLYESCTSNKHSKQYIKFVCNIIGFCECSNKSHMDFAVVASALQPEFFEVLAVNVLLGFRTGACVADSLVYGLSVDALTSLVDFDLLQYKSTNSDEYESHVHELGIVLYLNKNFQIVTKELVTACKSIDAEGIGPFLACRENSADDVGMRSHLRDFVIASAQIRKTSFPCKPIAISAVLPRTTHHICIAVLRVCWSRWYTGTLSSPVMKKLMSEVDSVESNATLIQALVADPALVSTYNDLMTEVAFSLGISSYMQGSLSWSHKFTLIKLLEGVEDVRFQILEIAKDYKAMTTRFENSSEIAQDAALSLLKVQNVLGKGVWFCANNTTYYRQIDIDPRSNPDVRGIYLYHVTGETGLCTKHLCGVICLSENELLLKGVTKLGSKHAFLKLVQDVFTSYWCIQVPGAKSKAVTVGQFLANDDFLDGVYASGCDAVFSACVHGGCEMEGSCDIFETERGRLRTLFWHTDLKNTTLVSCMLFERQCAMRLSRTEPVDGTKRVYSLMTYHNLVTTCSASCLSPGVACATAIDLVQRATTMRDTLIACSMNSMSYLKHLTPDEIVYIVTRDPDLELIINPDELLSVVKTSVEFFARQIFSEYKNPVPPSELKYGTLTDASMTGTAIESGVEVSETVELYAVIGISLQETQLQASDVGRFLCLELMDGAEQSDIPPCPSGGSIVNCSTLTKKKMVHCLKSLSKPNKDSVIFVDVYTRFVYMIGMALKSVITPKVVEAGSKDMASSIQKTITNLSTRSIFARASYMNGEYARDLSNLKIFGDSPEISDELVSCLEKLEFWVKPPTCKHAVRFQFLRKEPWKETVLYRQLKSIETASPFVDKKRISTLQQQHEGVVCLKPGQKSQLCTIMTGGGFETTYEVSKNLLFGNNCESMLSEVVYVPTSTVSQVKDFEKLTKNLSCIVLVAAEYGPGLTYAVRDNVLVRSTRITQVQETYDLCMALILYEKKHPAVSSESDDMVWEILRYRCGMNDSSTSDAIKCLSMINDDYETVSKYENVLLCLETAVCVGDVVSFSIEIEGDVDDAVCHHSMFVRVVSEFMIGLCAQHATQLSFAVKFHKSTQVFFATAIAHSLSPDPPDVRTVRGTHLFYALGAVVRKTARELTTDGVPIEPEYYEGIPPTTDKVETTDVPAREIPIAETTAAAAQRRTDTLVDDPQFLMHQIYSANKENNLLTGYREKYTVEGCSDRVATIILSFVESDSILPQHESAFSKYKLSNFIGTSDTSSMFGTNSVSNAFCVGSSYDFIFMYSNCYTGKTVEDRELKYIIVGCAAIRRGTMIALPWTDSYDLEHNYNMPSPIGSVYIPHSSDNDNSKYFRYLSYIVFHEFAQGGSAVTSVMLYSEPGDLIFGHTQQREDWKYPILHSFRASWDREFDIEKYYRDLGLSVRLTGLRPGFPLHYPFSLGYESHKKERIIHLFRPDTVSDVESFRYLIDEDRISFLPAFHENRKCMFDMPEQTEIVTKIVKRSP